MPDRVWRDGERIRRANGTGYNDRVTDEQIAAHRAAALVRIRECSKTTAEAVESVEFCDAVLALRADERAQAGR